MEVFRSCILVSNESAVSLGSKLQGIQVLHQILVCRDLVILHSDILEPCTQFPATYSYLPRLC